MHYGCLCVQRIHVKSKSKPSSLYRRLFLLTIPLTMFAMIVNILMVMNRVLMNNDKLWNIQINVLSAFVEAYFHSIKWNIYRSFNNHITWNAVSFLSFSGHVFSRTINPGMKHYPSINPIETVHSFISMVKQHLHSVPFYQWQTVMNIDKNTI